MAELHVPRINRTVCTIPGFHDVRIPSHLTHEYDAHLVSHEQNSTSIFTSPLNTSRPMAIAAHEHISTIHTKQKHYTPINPPHSLACDNPAPPHSSGHSAAAAQLTGNAITPTTNKPSVPIRFPHTRNTAYLRKRNFIHIHNHRQHRYRLLLAM
jgi:hypothetical protein